MHVDLDTIRANIKAATTSDLLDRVTIDRNGMDPEAVEMIEAELRSRGVTAAQQVDHEADRAGVLRDADGIARRCARCSAPAVAEAYSWHRLWGVLPLFPRRVALCAAHAPSATTPVDRTTQAT